MKPLTIAQTIFRDWCAYHGAVVDVAMAADLVRRIEAAISDERLILKKRPVAFRVKDYADGWIIFQDEPAAYALSEDTGAVMQGLYVRDGT